jgi:transcriptional regulator GlxA family with amidase domain
MSKLKPIQNWPKLARAANWSIAALARRGGVCQRTLHRHFRQHLGQNPKPWMAELCLHHATTLLHAGISVREVAGILGCQQPSNFTRQYKKYCGIYLV